MADDQKKVKDQELRDIEQCFRVHPNFPKAPIVFRDILPVLTKPKLFGQMIDRMCELVKNVSRCDRILGIEARGFLLGPSVARQLNLPFVAIRKKGKLPGATYTMEYDLEYGHDALEVQKYALPCDSYCVIVDDLMATGGSIEATKKLVEICGSSVAAAVVVIELESLGGQKRLGKCPCYSLFKY